MTAADLAVLDGPTALRLLREVVGERPDHVYMPPGGEGTACRYVHRGKPSCLVGHVLARHGFTAEQLAALDDIVSALLLPQYFPGLVTEDAAQILLYAQGMQDAGHTWGEALTAAEETARRRGVSA
jgi:hypothetical protein